MLIHWYTITVFSYTKCILKNRLLYCTKSYIHRLPTYLPFLLNKMQFYQKCYHEKRFWKHLEEGLSSNSPKTLVSGNHTMHTQKNMLGQFLTSPTTRTLLCPTPHYHAYPTRQKPMDTQTLSFFLDTVWKYKTVELKVSYLLSGNLWHIILAHFLLCPKVILPQKHPLFMPLKKNLHCISGIFFLI